MAGGSAVDADGGAGFDEFCDGAGDRGLFRRLYGGAGTVGGGATDGRPAVDPVELAGIFELGEVAADCHAGDAEPLRQFGDVDLAGFLQQPDDVALTHCPCVLYPVDLRHTGNATGCDSQWSHRWPPREPRRESVEPSSAAGSATSASRFHLGLLLPLDDA